MTIPAVLDHQKIEEEKRVMTSSIPDSIPVDTHQNDLILMTTPESNRAGLSPLIVQSTNL